MGEAEVWGTGRAVTEEDHRREASVESGHVGSCWPETPETG